MLAARPARNARACVKVAGGLVFFHGAIPQERAPPRRSHHRVYKRRLSEEQALWIMRRVGSRGGCCRHCCRYDGRETTPPLRWGYGDARVDSLGRLWIASRNQWPAGYLSESRPPRWPTGNAHRSQPHGTASITRRKSAGRVRAGASFRQA